MTIWITGAAGFIGSTLAAALQGGEEPSFGLDLRVPEAPTIAPERFLTGNVSDDRLAKMLALSGPPHTVYHLAGGSSVGPSFADPMGDFSATVGSTVALLDFLRRHVPDATVVLASSAAVYGSDHEGEIDENAELNPFSPYGTHKRIMEVLGGSYARFFGLNIYIARLFSVYGAGLRKQIFWDLCSKLATGDPVTLGGAGDERRDFVHATDVARGLIALARADAKNRPVLVNLGSGEPTTIKRAADLVADAWARKTGRRATVSFSGDCRPGDPVSLLASTGRMRSLGFEPSITLEAGLDAYVDWFMTEAKRRS